MKYLLAAAGIGLALYGYWYFYQQKNAAPPPPPPPILKAAPPQILDRDATEKVRAATNDSDPNVRWQALQLLISAHDPEAEPKMLQMLRVDEDTSIRLRIIGILANRGDPKVGKFLIEALRDNDADVRTAALRGLSNIGDYSAAPSVSNLLRDPEERVRLEALQTLHTLQVKRNQEIEKIEEQRRLYEEEMRKRQTGEK